MNNRTGEVTVIFISPEDVREDQDLRVSEAFDLLFKECDIEAFFRNNKKDVELSGNGKRDSLGCCCTGSVSE